MITLDLDSPVVKAVTQTTNPATPEWEFPIAQPTAVSPINVDNTEQVRCDLKSEDLAIPFNISSIFDIGIDKKRQVYIPSANTPSQLGFECDRNLVFRRTRGQDAQKIPIRRQSVFEFGKNVEEYAVKMLIEGGAKITETQRSLKDYDINLSARIDCMIYHPQLADKPMLCEIKSFSSLEFPRYNKPEDFLKSDKHYYRNYYTQLQCYLYLLSLDKQQFEESAILFLVSKSGRETKDIRFYRDDDFIEENVIKKCERINKYVKDNIVPEAMCYDEAVCGDCPFPHICDVGQVSGQGYLFLDKPELVEAIREWKALESKLKDDNKRCSELEDFVKGTIKECKKQTGRDYFLLDNYEAKVTTVKSTKIVLPEELKEKYKVPNPYDKVVVNDLTKKNKEVKND